MFKGLNIKRKVRHTGWQPMDGEMPALNSVTRELPLKWRIPALIAPRLGSNKNSKRSNRYLLRQELRFNQAMMNHEYRKGMLILMNLMQRSKSFFIYSLNKTLKGWFWSLDQNALKRIISEVKFKTKWLETNTEVRRIYIPKSNGRFRPVGVPSPSTRIYLFMLTQYISRFTELNLQGRQYGFRHGLGIWDAWREIFREFDSGKRHVYEFDLSGCFNRISLAHTLKKLFEDGMPGEFVLLLEKLLSQFPRIGKEVMKESELTVSADGTTIIKNGIPQGFAMSPCLATYMMSKGFADAELDPILYADDGVLVEREEKELSENQVEILEAYGMFFSKKLKKDGTPSNGWVDTLNFLGISWDIRQDKILIGALSISRRMMNWNLLVHLMEDPYVPKKSGKWSININAYVLNIHRIWCKENLINLMNWLGRKGRVWRFGVLFIDYVKESSICCHELFKEDWIGGGKRRRPKATISKFAFEGREHMSFVEQTDHPWYWLPGPDLFGNKPMEIRGGYQWLSTFPPINRNRKGKTWLETRDETYREIFIRETLRKRALLSEDITIWRFSNPVIPSLDWRSRYQRSWWPAEEGGTLLNEMPASRDTFKPGTPTFVHRLGNKDWKNRPYIR